MSLAAQSLWPIANTGYKPRLPWRLVDLDGGHASVAVAGDCLALQDPRGRLANKLQLANRRWGRITDFMYLSHSIQLSLRERILLVADEPLRRPAKLVIENRRQLCATGCRIASADDGGRCDLHIRCGENSTSSRGESRNEHEPTASIVAGATTLSD